MKGFSKRYSYCRFVETPKLNPGVTTRGLIEHFLSIMSKNRSINDDYRGDKSKYWNVRAEHNEHLKVSIKYYLTLNFELALILNA